MKEVFVGAGFVAALFAQTAGAADLSPVPVYRAPPPVIAPYFTWTGCHLGGNAGGVWVHKEWFNGAAFPGVTVTGLGPIPAAPAGIGFGAHTASGGIGGVQAGCDYQVGTWVFGLQGDYDWTSATGSNVNPVLTALRDQSSIQSVASVTARVGYAWDRFLLYARAGGAWERDNYSFIVTTLGAPFGTTSEQRVGWTAGVGGEYAFLDWLTGFVEYDFYGFGTQTNNFNCSVSGCSSVILPVDIKEYKNVFKVGLNFRFGPRPPEVARY